MNQAKTPPAKSVKSAVRALEILDVLTREGRPLAFTEFLGILGYPEGQSACHPPDDDGGTLAAL